MNQVTDNLAVASEAEVIHLHENQLIAQAHSIIVLSLGSIIPEAIRCADKRYITLPNVLDECSTFMLDLWLLLRAELKGCSTLIHCQLGQSRSVATVAAMMVLLESWEVSAALSTIRTVRPSIAINPSFLAQLYFLSIISSDCNDEEINRAKLPIFHLLRWQHHVQALTILADHIPLQQRFMDAMNKPVQCTIYQRVILCKACKHQLAVDGDVISVSINTDAFVEANIDEFWRPSFAESKHIQCTRPPIKGSIVTRPLQWMLEQGKDSSGECDLHCPSATCQAVIGIWRKRCLDVISPHLLCDLFALKQIAVLLQRRHSLV